jgi:hypothetical protein
VAVTTPTHRPSSNGVTRSLPALLRLIVLAALAGFWLAVALIVAMMAASPDVLVIILGVAEASAVAATLGGILRLRLRRLRSTGLSQIQVDPRYDPPTPRRPELYRPDPTGSAARKASCALEQSRDCKARQVARARYFTWAMPKGSALQGFRQP